MCLTCAKIVIQERLETNGSSTKHDMSFMERFLVQTESLHAQLGRYNSPDENAFFEALLPQSIVRSSSNSDASDSRAKVSPLKPNRININDEVMTVYTERILSELCKSAADAPADDGQYGSACACDIAVLQALSKRIHYGKFVAEAKFQAEKARFSAMIEANNAEGIMEALTNIAVEDAVVERVRLKASRYGTDGSESSGNADQSNAYKVEPQVISQLYRDFLIPLNKNVQVEYLLQRLERPAFAYAGSNDSAASLASAMRAGATRFCEGEPHLAMKSVEEVFLSLSRNQVAYGIVPIQDAGGFCKATQRALLGSDLQICGACVDPESPSSRFYVVSSRRAGSSPSTSHVVMFFGTPNEPGSLARALKALDNVNLACLESIPDPTKENSFAFFCEIQGLLLDPLFAELRNKLDKVTDFVRLAGSY